MKMKKAEVVEIITSKATEYGFKVEDGGMLPQIKSDNLNISVMVGCDYDKSDMANGKVWMNVTIQASISSAGGNPTPDELLVVADEIARGARMAAELQNMNLSFIYES